ncbi:hypothetical protein K0M31_001474 [Melipona bicolor]|uniref:Uncharacterized protein n=1 Tax=Melipona bicolor TaxID=60889 RepID=A0AA40GFV9_9HYME|nr:hypothetical protein K0M31_001474 [Melipona bicolor]
MKDQLNSVRLNNVWNNKTPSKQLFKSIINALSGQTILANTAWILFLRGEFYGISAMARTSLPFGSSENCSFARHGASPQILSLRLAVLVNFYGHFSNFSCPLAEKSS